MRKGLTLLEVILAIIILTIIIGSVYRSYTFFISNVAFYVKRADVHMQIDYAMENIRLHCLSASSINTPFPSGMTSSRDNFNFIGENVTSNITENDPTDDATYNYFVGSSGTFNGFLLEKFRNGRSLETLIDGSLNPVVRFTYNVGTEPDFMTVFIEAGPPDSRINRTQGLRFWFVDIVQ